MECLSETAARLWNATQAPTAQLLTTGTIRLLVVGDVHYSWGPEDLRAIQHLSASAVLLLGDFGEEALEIVESVATLTQPVAVILGNHDAW